MTRKHYVLTERAANDLREAKAWSLARWGKKLTDEYFDDLHNGAQHIAQNHKSLRTRTELTGKTGLFLYPVREHYIVYLPIEENLIVVVSVIRQVRDIPAILAKWNYQIKREIERIHDRIEKGEIKFNQY